VQLRFRTQADAPHLEVAGTIVRTSTDPSSDFLGRLIAVEFDEAMEPGRLQELQAAYPRWQ
jgi:hypothetical protein